jgi:chemotaxis protein methyltransferase CheR
VSSDTSSDEFDRLLEFLSEEIGFESDYYNRSYLDRRVTARIRRTGTDDYADYLSLLRAETDEREALLNSLSINVTEFFRNTDMWEALRPVLRKLTAENRTVRVWSAPSSDGREPYSLAMLALDDDEVDARRLDILGTDIDREVLRSARRGVYHTSRTTDIESELAPLSDYEPYVRREERRFEVRDEVKELVTFEQHDLIRGEPKSDFDLVFCRNLLIYIATEYKREVVETIADSLDAGGYLVVGMTETLPREVKPAFEPIDKRHRIYRKR